MKRIICDIDGVLCFNDRVSFKKKILIADQIMKLNKLYDRGNKIILFTSRKSRYRKHTLKWLKTNFVKFHKLIMDKPKADYYVDDKSVKMVTDIK